LEFAKGLFAHSQNAHAFNQHLRDFLVNMKEFADADNSELYREEQELKEQQEAAQRSAVPGLLKPIDIELQQFSQSTPANPPQ
jgi:exportin-1